MISSGLKYHIIKVSFNLFHFDESCARGMQDFLNDPRIQILKNFWSHRSVDLCFCVKSRKELLNHVDLPIHRTSKLSIN